MFEISVSKARASLGDVVDTARVQRQPVYLTRHGKRVAVIAGIEQWVGTSPVGEEVNWQNDALVGQAKPVTVAPVQYRLGAGGEQEERSG